MSDAPAGGRTVFPRLGLGIEPLEGAAVFWYNLFENGDPDQVFKFLNFRFYEVTIETFGKC